MNLPCIYIHLVDHYKDWIKMFKMWEEIIYNPFAILNFDENPAPTTYKTARLIWAKKQKELILWALNQVTES